MAFAVIVWLLFALLSLLRLVELLIELDRTIVSANIFENFISQDYGLPGGQNAAVSHRCDSFKLFLFVMYTRVTVPADSAYWPCTRVLLIMVIGAGRDG